MFFLVNTNTAENCPLVYFKTSSVDMLINAETPSQVSIFMINLIHAYPNNENSPQSSYCECFPFNQDHDLLAHSFRQHFILVTGLRYKTFKYFFDSNVPFDKRVKRFLK